jgi:hypothetical protein
MGFIEHMVMYIIAFVVLGLAIWLVTMLPLWVQTVIAVVAFINFIEKYYGKS